MNKPVRNAIDAKGRPRKGTVPPIGLIRPKHRPGSGYYSKQRLPRLQTAPAQFVVFKAEVLRPVVVDAQSNESQLRDKDGRFIAKIVNGVALQPAQARRAA